MRIFPLIVLIFWGCSKNETGDKVGPYYDSLAQALFLSPQVDMKVVSNIDSFRIEFFDSTDFQIMIETRRLCQVIGDSIGLRFKTGLYNINDFGELEINVQILEYDTLLYPLIEKKYLKRQNKKTFDSLTAEIGITPVTIIDFHNKVTRYFHIVNRDNSFSDSKKNLVITYYVTELTTVPYPRTLYRIFVNDKNEIIESRKHEDFDKKAIPVEDSPIQEATAYNSAYKNMAVDELIIEYKLLISFCNVGELSFSNPPHFIRQRYGQGSGNRKKRRVNYKTLDSKFKEVRT